MLLNYSNSVGLKTERSGIIPYCTVNKSLYFLIGEDYKSGELTDFGGGVRVNLGEDCLIGGSREFKEETLGCLSNNYYEENGEDFKKSVIVSDKNKMTIIFLKIDSKWFNDAVNNFVNKKQTSNFKHHEIDKIMWFHETRFRKLINGFNKDRNIMWEKVRKFLIKINNDEFFDILKQK